MATRRPMAPRIERITLRLLGVPALENPARWLFISGVSASCVRVIRGQRQIVEEDLHEFLLREVEDEVVFSPVGIARLAGAAPLAATALRPLDVVAANVFAVAGMDHLARAAAAVAEHRLADVAPGQVDVLALLDVADAALVDCLPDRVAHLALEAAQETLAVADRLVLAGEAPIDDLLEHRGPSLVTSSF